MIGLGILSKIGGLLLGKIGWKGLAALSIAGIIYFGYRHYDGLVDAKAELTAEVAQLAQEGEQLRVDKGELESALHRNELMRQEQEEQIQELSIAASAAQREARRLNDIFAEHDLTRLTLAKPGLIERRINAGTARVGRLLECASGEACADSE